ncbi:p53-like transcription factor [Tothia fuscella]|uniref:P53-like transcription factor n=1 Tax=Tothia fuscella TaxID=1048955 RepID=A0A9P4NP92_9PEZI|nr:p53-like transcription factor [Tothia fuscella]
MPLLPLDQLDHHSNYDAETFAGSEDATQYGHLPHTPSLKRFPSTYEDHFSDSMSQYDHAVPPDQHSMESPSIERDNKLLSFSVPTSRHVLLDYTYRRTSVSICAQLHGMFFLAESPWAAIGEISTPVAELTCYRRNLFQISGNAILPRGLRYILTDQGEQIPIIAQELTVSAVESVEGNSVKIISVPWKTQATSVPVVEVKTEKEPQTMPLDLSTGREVDSDFVSIPISWKRLQFRIATANNGRRKELQQHFVVHLKVMATLATGVRVSICEVHSGAIIVRGRSPRNFQSRKDFPITGGSTTRKGAHIPAPPTRTSTGDSSLNQPKQEPSSAASAMEIPQVPFQYIHNDVHVSPDFFEWKVPVGQMGAMTAIPPEPPFTMQPSPNAYAHSSPDLQRYPLVKPQHLPSQPITLSLTDEGPKKDDSSEGGPRKAPRLSHVSARPPSFSISLISGGDESVDFLYEYFPLGLDDWMPPVDAVYRPHVVHHTNLPSDPKALAVKNRSKRYFSEDQP